MALMDPTAKCVEKVPLGLTWLALCHGEQWEKATPLRCWWV